MPRSPTLRVLGHARAPVASGRVAEPSARTRVLVADPAGAARAGLRRFLGAALDLVVAGEAASGTDALALARSGAGDVLLLHERVADPDVFEVLSRLHVEHPALAIVVVGDETAAGRAHRALALGAAAYLDACASPEEFVGAVRTAARRARSPAPSTAAGAPDDLSGREFQVLRLLALGKSTAGIGEALSIAPSTVRTFKARLREKLGLATDAALVRYALDRRLA